MPIDPNSFLAYIISVALKGPIRQHHTSSFAGLFGGPVAPVVLAGLRPAAKEGVCWRGGTAATPAHSLLLLSDPRAGREHLGHSMRFRNTKTKRPIYLAICDRDIYFSL